jgi:hypothetical protein
VNDKDRSVVLHGCNLGNWLLNGIWMMDRAHKLGPISWDRALHFDDVLAWLGKSARSVLLRHVFIRKTGWSSSPTKSSAGRSRTISGRFTSTTAALGRTAPLKSFHGRFRNVCLNREQLGTLTEARVLIKK